MNKTTNNLPDMTQVTPTLEPDGGVGDASGDTETDVPAGNEVICGTDGMIAVNDDGDSVTITTDCGFVPINGNDTHVALQNAETVVINGNNVVVTALKIESLIVNGSNVTVNATGIDGTPINNGDGNTISIG